MYTTTGKLGALAEIKNYFFKIPFYLPVIPKHTIARCVSRPGFVLANLPQTSSEIRSSICKVENQKPLNAVALQSSTWSMSLLLALWCTGGVRKRQMLSPVRTTT